MSGPTPSQSIEMLFETLTTEDVERFVLDRRAEDLQLEFKAIATSFKGTDDRKTLAKIISGFANSTGGVVVWGVEGRRGPGDDVDCAQGTVPLVEPSLFMSLLTEYAASAASPVVVGVRHRLVEGAGGPFALTYVPESDSGPHMAKNGEDRYYQRSGDRFLKMEHFAIADMFGRRRRPRLALDLQKEPEGSLIIALANEGRGVAKSPYLALVLPPNFRPSPHGFDGNGNFGLRYGGWANQRITFGGDTDRVIHSGQHLFVSRIEATTITPDGRAVIKGLQVFRYELGAEDVALEYGERVVDY